MMGAVLIRSTGAVPGSMKKSDWNREILKPSYEELGKEFHKNYLPLRFTRRGAKLLNYMPRKGEESGLSRKEFFKSYTGRKVRSKGHKDPLRWSDESMNLARIRDIRATGKGVKVVIHARGLNRRNANSRIVMSDEVRRVAKEEERPLVATLDNAIQSNIDGYNDTKTVRK